jgi:hypothetical protein
MGVSDISTINFEVLMLACLTCPGSSWTGGRLRLFPCWCQTFTYLTARNARSLYSYKADESMTRYCHFIMFSLVRHDAGIVTA